MRSILPFSNLRDVLVLLKVELGSYEVLSSFYGIVSFRSELTKVRESVTGERFFIAGRSPLLP